MACSASSRWRRASSCAISLQQILASRRLHRPPVGFGGRQPVRLSVRSGRVIAEVVDATLFVTDSKRATTSSAVSVATRSHASVRPWPDSNLASSRGLESEENIARRREPSDARQGFGKPTWHVGS